MLLAANGGADHGHVQAAGFGQEGLLPAADLRRRAVQDRQRLDRPLRPNDGCYGGAPWSSLHLHFALVLAAACHVQTVLLSLAT